ncbi:Acetoin:2,6-dichlorophenolindophenol oxidoreductase subunit alpha [Thalassovita gelatinovora]|uniref:Pyruvate dehydrogenase E1 component subunit alpha n=1 Tax=Thalassovita gelatinovora TaxID=53501 RepID=A0A0P1FHS1_THAGE|nr:pyruvate dehydrogenase (acetyl-transferring) E1 component subunit alpha [Thalassovita gelatinovora]QIZ82045.1 pyruvate dehydrogenase (acetyl-transferring) E1 component subunit alpha [Thalassovita gelatinovora]CUH67539.1 Acetoin:2,6-dichlorophenolindophenol oxidoreductase subunit alpha [Thalassovita gelatinovora]SEP72176.1 2-oxoisovalerate dehydrogenase E1 component [Thalassovita gelatinovora]
MTPAKIRLSRDHVLNLLGAMMRVRKFEDKCAELYTQEKIRGFLHLYDGEEAIAAGIIPLLAPDDRIVATYREHGHALIRGVPMTSVMAEMYGKVTGCSGGRGGSMHIFDKDRNFYGGNAIVGGGLPLAGGLALGDRMQDSGNVTTCFFGEGAVAEGEFHETMNLAQLWQVPALFICENNGYAMGTALGRSESQTDIHQKAASYGIPSEVVDGNDVVAVEAAARRALAAIRETAHPYFLECRTYRFRAHSMFDAQLYRDKAEVEEWRKRGPILRFRTWALAAGLIHDADIADLETRIDAEIADAVEFAEKSDWEPVANLARHVVAEDQPAKPDPAVPSGETVEMTYREAVKQGIRDAMIRDDGVFLMGEDVGAYGGCYAVSKGLMDEFGPDRIRDTPLSESGFTGFGIGAAAVGMRPIVELMTVNFSLLALDQIMNTAATIRHMSDGQFGVPVVIRMATGAGKQLAAQHSHSLEGWYAHIPGLRVLTPATLEDARGMLWTALMDPDPVLIFENVMLYNRSDQIDSNAGPVDIDTAAIRRPGRDISLITYGGSLYKTLEAAEELARDGIEAEVIDLRVLRPLDDATIIASVARTRRAVIVDEGWRSGSLSAEIAARIHEQAFWRMDAPVGRVCAAEVPIPYPKHLEDASIPQVSTIVAAAKSALGKG